VSFTAVSGTTYYIAVDGKGSAVGAVALNYEVPPPDTTNPSITSLTPADGATISGTVAVTAQASDNVAVASVAISVDGDVVATLTSAPYTYSLDTTTLSDGSHSVSAVATDTSNNTSTTVTNNVSVHNHDTTGLTISAGASVSAGKAVTITGVLTDTSTNTALGGATVALFGRPNTTGSSFTQVATTISTSSGAVTLSEKPTANTVYEWRYAGSSGAPIHAAATSADKTVTVAQVVTAAFSPTKIKHGKSGKLFGTVSPTETGQKVTVQMLVKGKWKSTSFKATIKTQKLPSGKKASGYVIVIKEKKKGTYTFRVSRAATSSNAAGVSGSAKLKVT
jgi:Bacterial Ig domain